MIIKLIKDLGMLYPTKNSKRKARYGLYECPICFKYFKTQTSQVKNKTSTKCRSCASTTHGNRFHKLYHTWDNQKQRCNNKNNKDFLSYGGKGIIISKEFNEFNIWLTYVESLEDAYKNTYSIDRINNDGNYERNNLRWASKNTQTRNTRKLQSNNTSGYRCVSWSKQNCKWNAGIMINSKTIHIGYFSTKLEAAKAYDIYVIKHNLKHTINGVLYSNIKDKHE